MQLIRIMSWVPVEFLTQPSNPCLLFHPWPYHSRQDFCPCSLGLPEEVWLIHWDIDLDLYISHMTGFNLIKDTQALLAYLQDLLPLCFSLHPFLPSSQHIRKAQMLPFPGSLDFPDTAKSCLPLLNIKRLLKQCLQIPPHLSEVFGFFVPPINLAVKNE